jgi:hypothetical protein
MSAQGATATGPVTPCRLQCYSNRDQQSHRSSHHCDSYPDEFCKIQCQTKQKKIQEIPFLIWFVTGLLLLLFYYVLAISENMRTLTTCLLAIKTSCKVSLLHLYMIINSQYCSYILLSALAVCRPTVATLNSLWTYQNQYLEVTWCTSSIQTL